MEVPVGQALLECCSLKKETDTSEYTKEHEDSNREAKSKIEGLTNKPNTSYDEAGNSNSNAGSINQELAAKDKEMAELMATVNKLRSN